MKVLITGAQGQLGHDLQKHLSGRYTVFGTGRSELDITDLDAVKRLVYTIRPNVVVHAAAYTAVDRAESEPEAAYLVNADGTRNMALSAQEVGAKFCYVSTDYVFDGTSSEPYREFDRTNPTGVYGLSKRAGEEVTIAISDRFYIVRTSWVYGVHGSNFVKTILKLAKEKERLNVVSDQIGSPTYTTDLSRFIGNLISTEKFGIYHARTAVIVLGMNLQRPFWKKAS